METSTCYIRADHPVMVKEKTMKKLESFRVLEREIAHLRATRNLLSWDQEVMMPSGGAEARAAVESSLAAVIHEKSTAAAYVAALEDLNLEVADGQLAGPDAILVQRAWKACERERKLPPTFVREMAALQSMGQGIWAEARKASDFAKFQPALMRMVDMRREMAELIGYEASPYDALLDEFEPDTRVSDIRPVLASLRSFLAPFVARINASAVKPDPDEYRLPARKDAQERVCRTVAEAMGFDFSRGRLDVSTHPFTNRIHVGDTRITTRFDEDDLLEALSGTTHEAGHGLYEQGLPEKWYGLPIGESISMGIHESQSRVWENMVGRSQAFCRWLAGVLQKERHVYEAPERLYQAMNIVRPSFIRVEADEVTYNLHICLRFEIELDLIEGRLEVKDLRDAWNAKTREYLGIEPPDDARGVLQDIHWSLGYFGYFPTYALGNLYAAQFYDAAAREIPYLEQAFAGGDFQPFRHWLRSAIHRHGNTLTAAELVRTVTGGPLDAKHFTGYLERKYGALYRL